MSVVLVILLVGAVVGTVWLVSESRGGVESETTSKDPSQVIASAVASIPVGTVSMRSSWMPTGHSDRSASFVYKRRPSILVALVGLLFFLVPGILYLVFAGKSQTLQVDCLSTAAGVTTVQVASSGGYARRRGRVFLGVLAATPAPGT